ncbi:MAG: carboxypeptidase-like regulatory domain-containing protein, partial [Duncaniella sp.]|nr:carboxypeptidase-like regulatory domain-containing protein [Duncaniella sp.]
MHKRINSISKYLAMATLGVSMLPGLSLVATEPPVSIVAPPAQTYTVKGVVIDESGEPLPGATVMVKGSKIGTSADIDGNFELSVNKGGKLTLVVSYVGMKTKEVQTSTGSSVDIELETNADMLAEVIVSGFQTISRERNTGSAVVVNSEKLGKIQAPDLSSKLDGITPGLT